ncbi:MAG: acetyl-CoA carboxylase biotin carboxyl carrier protein subunit [Chloroflexota bacterium]
MNMIQLNNDQIALIVRDATQATQTQGELIAQIPDFKSPIPIRWRRLSPNTLSISSPFGEETIHFAEDGGTYYLHGYGRNFQATVLNPLTQSSAEGGQGGTIAPMPGTVVSLNVGEGDSITKGQLLLTIESMKMLTDITADRDGTVTEVHLSAGDTFDKGAVLVTIE